jgi:hypothetical protein
VNERPTDDAGRRPKRLDERVAPGWANLSATLLRGGGVLAGLFLLWVGFVTGGFFLLLTGFLGALALIGGWLLGGLMTRESWYERPNARPLSIVLVIGFPLMLVAVAQFAGPLLTPPPNLAACYSGTLARGEERHEPLAVDPRIDSMVFRLVIHDVTGGALRYFVVDANGESVWSGRPDIAGTYESDQIESHGGQWMVNLIAEAEQSTYQLEWTATTADGQSGVPHCP